MKLCKDCVFNYSTHLASGLKEHRCSRLLQVRPDPVTGNMKEFGKVLNCDNEREVGIIASYLLDCCGKSARYFKPKE